MREAFQLPDSGWKPTGQEDAGHKWEGWYQDDVLRYVRCSSCHVAPIEILRVDMTFAPCHGESVRRYPHNPA